MNNKGFYEGRIEFILANHDFSTREQMLGMVLNAAMSDRSLSVSDLLSVISQIEEAHNKSLEANFNDGWN